MENRLYAVVENNKVVNIIVGVDPKVLASNPDMYIDYTDGWDFDNGIDGGIYLIKPLIIIEPQIS
jgi:hypothetical protein